MTITYKGCSRDNLTSNKNMVELIFFKIFKISTSPSQRLFFQRIFNSGTTFTACKSNNVAVFYLIDLTLTISVYTSR